MKIAAIINPNSASGETYKIWKKIKGPAIQRLGQFEEIVTRSQFEATGFARQLSKNKFDLIIIMGGDGTIHEVINGLLDAEGKPYNPDLKLGIMSSGRGCDFIKSLHLPTDPREGLSIILDGRTRKVDVGYVKYTDPETQKPMTKYFINSFSYGLGGDVAKDISYRKTYLHPTLSYLIATSLKFFTSGPYNFRVFVGDEKREMMGPFMNLFACNGRFSGSGMYWAPQAQIDDGVLDLVLVRPIGKLKLMTVAHKIYDGTFQKLSEVTHAQATKIFITSEKPGWVEIDGEVAKAQNFELGLIPKTLEFMVP